MRGKAPPGAMTRSSQSVAAAARAAMNLDKKVQRGRLRFILMRGIGRAFVTADWPPEALERTLVAQFG